MEQRNQEEFQNGIEIIDSSGILEHQDSPTPVPTSVNRPSTTIAPIISAQAHSQPTPQQDNTVSFDQALDAINAALRCPIAANCFISRAWEENTNHKNHKFTKKLVVHLKRAGINAVVDSENLVVGERIDDFVSIIKDESYFVIVLFTPRYKQRWEENGHWIRTEVDCIKERLKKGRKFYIPILIEGKEEESIPAPLLYEDDNRTIRSNHLYQDMTNPSTFNDDVNYLLKNKLLSTENLLPQTARDPQPAVIAQPPIARDNQLQKMNDHRPYSSSFCVVICIIISLAVMSCLATFYYQAITTPISCNFFPGKKHKFIGRQDILENLAKDKPRYSSFNHFSFSFFHIIPTDIQKSVLYGLPGNGKTETAKEYAQHSIPYTSKFWLSADGNTTIISELEKFLEDQHLLNNDEIIQENNLSKCIRLYKNWLRNHPNFLIIFDNVHSYDEISKYLPEEGIGHVIITTKNKTWPVESYHLHEVGKLTEETALSLLQSIMNKTNEEFSKMNNLVHTKSVLKNLDYLPLAIIQAGALMKGKSKPMNSTEYLQYFAANKKEVLNKAYGIQSRTLTTTFMMSIKRIISEPYFSNDLTKLQMFYEVLTIASYASSDRIPETLFEKWINLQFPVEEYPTLDTKFLLQEVLDYLREYSIFIFINIHNHIYYDSMHRLFQEIWKYQLIDDNYFNREWYEKLLKFFLNAPKDFHYCNPVTSIDELITKVGLDYKAELNDFQTLCGPFSKGSMPKFAKQIIKNFLKR